MTQFNQALNTDLNSMLTNGVYDTTVAQWMIKTQMYVQTSGGVWTPLTLDANAYLKTSVKDSALPTGASTLAKQDTLIGHVDGIEALLTSSNGYVDGIEGKMDTLNAKDFATQTTLALILTQLGTTGLKKIIDALPAGNNNIGDVDVATTVLPAGSGTLHELNLTLTAAVQQLSSQACRSVTIQAEHTNVGFVYIGRMNTVSASVHSYTLSPGGSITIQCSNTNLLYVIGTSGDKICGGGEV